MDVLDKLPSFDVGATPRRSTSSLDTTHERSRLQFANQCKCWLGSRLERPSRDRSLGKWGFYSTPALARCIIARGHSFLWNGSLLASNRPNAKCFLLGTQARGARCGHSQGPILHCISYRGTRIGHDPFVRRRLRCLTIGSSDRGSRLR